ncbi:hypothetical protein SAY87_006515 [Trapa incisa]|uniref:S-protein homolog n=1 Tax=Trapa incisa TaxID=236973 RepID=A0AAN7JWN3_9MYRT|nr:hypothetical protein SAY87_006515 [Trapa incisa]
MGKVVEFSLGFLMSQHPLTSRGLASLPTRGIPRRIVRHLLISWLGSATVLPSGHSFTIHCKSKDDDLGAHTIWPNDVYTFEFHNNVWGTTLFYCSVTTSYGQGVYDFYRYDRDNKRCDVCVYTVTKDGVNALSTKPGRNDFIFNWK